MLTLRRTGQRFDGRRGRQAAWCTFSTQSTDAAGAAGFGGLAVLDEICLPPGVALTPCSRRGDELITYVHEGALHYEDSLGDVSSMQTGEFRCLSAAPGVRSQESNSSRKNWTRLFRLCLGSSAERKPGREQKRFSVAQRRDGLCLIASASARAGSLRVHQDGVLYSALLRPGQHLVHDLAPGRRAWLHVVKGAVAFRELVLVSGDAVGVDSERSLSFTALTEAEVLLVDVT